MVPSFVCSTCLLFTILRCVAAGVFNCKGGMLSFVAHPDDDLLFQSPDLLSYISSDTCITTVFLTSGDAGLTTSYSESREAGNEAAYAQMGGVSDTYTQVNATLGGQQVLVRTLTGMPGIQKVYFRLPDGGMDGNGFSYNNYNTLPRLYFGVQSTLPDRYGIATWTLATLKNALADIITARQATEIASLDYLSDYDTGDHPDHQTVARMVNEIQSGLSQAAFNGYMAYPMAQYAPNVAGTSLTSKSAAFFVYTPYDAAECATYAACVSASRPEVQWLPRQYQVTTALKQNATQTTITHGAQVVSSGSLPCGTNLALSATATASSASYGQPASAVNDGVISGYPNNSSAEWVPTAAVGSWVNLTWTKSKKFDTIVLYDRPNTYDQVTSLNVTLKNGTTFTLGALYNDGSATIFRPGLISTTLIQFTIASVSFTTNSPGLSEVQLYLSTSSVCPSSSAVSSASATASRVSSLASGSIVQSSGLSSIQTSKAAQSSSASSFVQPSSVGKSVTQNYTDVALLATVTASSQAQGQGAANAVNGVAQGYPQNAYQEWATQGQGSGAWLQLVWSMPYQINSVSLWDRPNLDDQVLSGHLTFSDGSIVSFGTLPNDGSQFAVNFTARTTTSLLFTVDSVSSSTHNVGLAELAAYAAVPALSSSSALPSATLSIVHASSQSSIGSLTSVNSAARSTGSSRLISSAKPSSTSVVAAVSASPESDVALLASATASSWAADQPPSAAIDGCIDGYPGNYLCEWASQNEGAGAFLQLSWSQTYVIDRVILYDRLNLYDQVLSGTLSFSDGTSVQVGTLPNNGTGLTVAFAPVRTSSLVFNVNQVSSTTHNVGLAELQAFGYASSSVTSFSVAVSASATITTSASTVSATSQPNVALLAIADSSSESPSQEASKAIDGIVDGYPGDYTKEWASSGESEGAWLSLAFDSNYTISSVVLFDRPNLNDQVLSFTLQMSDGSVLSYGALANDGSATAFRFPPITTDSILFTVASVSSTTRSIGLAEMMVYGIPAQAASAGSSSSSNTQSLVNSAASAPGSVSSSGSRIAALSSSRVSSKSSGSSNTVLSNQSPSVTGSIISTLAKSALSVEKISSSSSSILGTYGLSTGLSIGAANATRADQTSMTDASLSSSSEVKSSSSSSSPQSIQAQTTSVQTSSSALTSIKLSSTVTSISITSKSSTTGKSSSKSSSKISSSSAKATSSQTSTNKSSSVPTKSSTILSSASSSGSALDTTAAKS